jgi:hypothetical protein
MDAAGGLALLRRSRDVRPNDGFLQQLLALDTDLRLVRQLGRAPVIALAGLEDLPDLPRPWNYEFYTKEVTDDEVGTPLVHLGEPCPLRLSGFSSLASTPPCSKSCSRRESRRSRGSRFPSKEPSFHGRQSRSRSREGLLSEGPSRVRSLLEESGDDLVTGDELEELCDGEEAEVPGSLEQVRQIITSPEERWRRLPGEQEEEQEQQEEQEEREGREEREEQEEREERASTSATGDLSYSTTSKPQLIQPAAEGDFLSLFKVSSAASWRALSSRLELSVLQEELPPAPTEGEPAGKEEMVPTSAKQLLAVCWQVTPQPLAGRVQCLARSGPGTIPRTSGCSPPCSPPAGAPTATRCSPGSSLETPPLPGTSDSCR